MSKQEGVIKFDLTYTPGPPLPTAEIEELNHWREILYRHNLIGQDPNRYHGYGFGNLSARLPPFDAPPQMRHFAISGTQTGEVAQLTTEHYAIVLECHPAENRLVATGPIRPSSESLTHSAVYAVDPTIRVVLHVHSPAIWTQAAALNLPITDAGVDYGTPEMAQEVARLFAATDLATHGIFAMGGHEDGIIAFGRTAAEAGEILLAVLHQAAPPDGQPRGEPPAADQPAADQSEETNPPPENDAAANTSGPQTSPSG